MEQRHPTSQTARSSLSQSSVNTIGTVGQAANFLSDALYRSPPPSYSSPPPPAYSTTSITGRRSNGTGHISRENRESNIPGSSRLYNAPVAANFSSPRLFTLPHRSQSIQGLTTPNSAQARTTLPRPLLLRRPPGDLSSFTISDIVAFPCDYSNVPLFEPSRPITPPPQGERRILPRPAHSLQEQQRRRQQRQQLAQLSNTPTAPTDEELLRAPKLVPKDLPYVGDSPGEIPSPPVTPPRRDSITQNPYPTPALSDEEDVPADGLGLFVASLRNRRFATRR